MATLNTFFAAVLLEEERLKDLVRRNFAQLLDPATLLDNPTNDVVQMVEALVGLARAAYPNMVRHGEEFARSINDGKPVAVSSGAAVEQSLIELRIAANAVGQRLVIDLETRIQQMASAGMSIDQAEAALAKGMSDPANLSPMVLTAINGFAAAIAAGVQRTASTTLTEVLAATPGQPNVNDKKWAWITVRDNRVCPDCEPRHNQIETLAHWQEIGMPKSGFSVCADRCRCMLMPAEYADEEIDTSKPVILTPAQVLRIGPRADGLLAE